MKARAAIALMWLGSCVTDEPVATVTDDGIDDDDGVPPEPPEGCPASGEPMTPGCPCEAAEPVSCYDGPAQTRDVGTCRSGLARCVPLPEGSRWSGCAGERLPADEVCNEDDDNCDGLIDEGVTNACGVCYGDCPPADPPLDAGDPPIVACESASAEPCALPPSICADGDWLVYYTGGECVSDVCSFEKHFEYCSNGCWGGGCSKGFT